jgi:hypothetical protein
LEILGRVIKSRAFLLRLVGAIPAWPANVADGETRHPYAPARLATSSGGDGNTAQNRRSL